MFYEQEVPRNAPRIDADEVGARREHQTLPATATASPASMFTATQAASVLRIEPATLRAWASRYGYPRGPIDRAQTGGYDAAQVLALAHTLIDAPSIAAAVARAQTMLSSRDQVQPKPSAAIASRPQTLSHAEPRTASAPIDSVTLGEPYHERLHDL